MSPWNGLIEWRFEGDASFLQGRLARFCECFDCGLSLSRWSIVRILVVYGFELEAGMIKVL